MLSCCALHCTNACYAFNHRPISFFHFPKDKKLLKAWLLKIKRADFVPTKYSFLCQEHFEDASFLKSPALLKSLGLDHTMRLRLKPDAVPTLFKYKSSDPEVGLPITESPQMKRLKRRNRQQIIAELLATSSCATASSATSATASNAASYNQTVESYFNAISMPEVKSEPMLYNDVGPLLIVEPSQQMDCPASRATSATASSATSYNQTVESYSDAISMAKVKSEPMLYNDAGPLLIVEPSQHMDCPAIPMNIKTKVASCATMVDIRRKVKYRSKAIQVRLGTDRYTQTELRSTRNSEVQCTLDAEVQCDLIPSTTFNHSTSVPTAPLPSPTVDEETSESESEIASESEFEPGSEDQEHYSDEFSSDD